MGTIRRAGVVVALLAIGLTARAAYGTTWVSASGTQCQTNEGEINHSMWGAYNPAQYYSDFVCPLPAGHFKARGPESNTLVALKYLDGTNAVGFFPARSARQISNFNKLLLYNRNTRVSDYGGCTDWKQR